MIFKIRSELIQFNLLNMELGGRITKFVANRLITFVGDIFNSGFACSWHFDVTGQMLKALPLISLDLHFLVL